METNRIIYLDIMRILAVFCVVILHVSATGFFRYPLYTTEWQVFNIFDSAVRFCVPLMVMISGALFLDPAKEIPVRKLYRKNILRVITAFLVWSAFYFIFLSGILQGVIWSFDEFLGSFFTGQIHMWFLYMIVGLYIIVPLLRKITPGKKLTEYFLIVALVFAIIIPAIMKADFPLHGVFAGNLENMNLYFILGFPVYFVAGYYFSKYPVKKTIRMIIYILGVLSVIFTIVMTSYISRSAYSDYMPNDLLHDYLLPNTAITTLALFLFFKSRFEGKVFTESAIKRISLLSKCSFGIFLVHVFFMVQFFMLLDFYRIIYNPAILIPVISVAIYACSFVVSFLLNKIPVLNRYIV